MKLIRHFLIFYSYSILLLCCSVWMLDILLCPRHQLTLSSLVTLLIVFFAMFVIVLSHLPCVITLAVCYHARCVHSATFRIHFLFGWLNKLLWLNLYHLCLNLFHLWPDDVRGLEEIFTKIGYFLLHALFSMLMMLILYFVLVCLECLVSNFNQI